MDGLDRLSAVGRAVLVTVVSTEGSVPREPGAWMLVFPQEVCGTVGGGRLEFDAIARARQLLEGSGTPGVQRFALGPSLGQCCGGVVHLSFEPVAAADRDRLRDRLAPALRPLALFGGGHVGQAIARLSGELPFALTWVDSREGIFPEGLAPRVQCEHSDPVQAAVPHLAPGSAVLVMSFSHAEDLDVVAACLRRRRERADLPFVGLIGSRTKWATFRHRLQECGFLPAELDAVHCPIGVPGIGGKEPAVIAIAALAQLLQFTSAQAATP